MPRCRLQLLQAVDLINETAYLQLARQARCDPKNPSPHPHPNPNP